MKRIATLLLVVFLLFALAACGGDDEEPEAAPAPSATPVQVATTAPEPTATEAPADESSTDEADGEAATGQDATAQQSEAPGAPSLTAGAFTQLSSYRSNITWRVSQADTVIQEVTMNMAETTSPSARQIEMSSNQGDFGLIQIEDTIYVNVGGAWQQIPAAGAGAMMEQMIFTPEEITDMTSGDEVTFEFIGAEQVNGIATNHYRLAFDPTNLPEEMAAGDVTNMNAEIWVANQPDLPSFAVRMQISYTGDFEGQTGSVFNLVWDVSDVNSGIVIEAPN